MKRTDSFFKKYDTSNKKQHDDEEVKEDKAQPRNSEPRNPLSAECTSDPSSHLAKVAQAFIPSGKKHSPGSIMRMGKCSVTLARNVQKSQMILELVFILVILQNKIKSNIISIQTIQAYLDLPLSN